MQRECNDATDFWKSLRKRQPGTKLEGSQQIELKEKKK